MSEQLTQLQEELEAIDAAIDEATQEAQMFKDVQELVQDEKYQRVIEGGFMESEGQRILEVLTTPMKFKREQNENMVEKLKSIRHLKEYLDVLLIVGEDADARVDALKLERVGATKAVAANDIEDAEIIEG